MAEKTLRQRFIELRKDFSDEELIKVLKRDGISSDDYDLPLSVAKAKGKERLAAGTSDVMASIGLGKQPPKPKVKPKLDKDYKGPTLSPGKKIEEEGFLTKAGRAILPDALGIEEAVLGKKPLAYDKEKVEAEIAKQTTIKPGEYEFSGAQIARPVGFAAGIGSEVAKQAAILPAAAVSLAETVEVGRKKARDPEKVLRDWAKEKGAPAQSFRTKASEEITKLYGGENPDDVLRRSNKDLYQLMQEDTEEVLAGTIQGIFTDIIPILPSKSGGGLQKEFAEAYKRGEAFPASVAAFGPIFVDAGKKVVDGDYQGAIRTLASRPATLAMTLLPFIDTLPPKLRAWVKKNTVRIKDAASEKVGEAVRTAGEYAGVSELPTRIKQTLADPLAQPTPEQAAKAELIYEESRATREKAKRAVDVLTKEAGEPVVTPEGKQIVTSEGTTSVTPEEAYIVELAKEYKKILDGNKEYLESIVEENIGSGIETIDEAHARFYKEAAKEALKKRPITPEQVAGIREGLKLSKERDVAATFGEEGLIYEKLQKAAKKISEDSGSIRNVGDIPEHILSDMELLHDEVIRRDTGKYPLKDIIEDIREEAGPLSRSLENLEKSGDYVQDVLDLAGDEIAKRKIVTEDGRVIEPPVQEVIKRTLKDEVVSSIEESFDTTLGFDTANKQLTPGIRAIIAEGAAKVLETDIGVFLGDSTIIKSFARKLVNKYGQKLGKANKDAATLSVERALEPYKRYGARKHKPASIEGLSEVLTEELILSELNDHLALNKKAKEQLTAEVRERVQFQVKNHAFKEALRQNIKYETGGIDRNTGKILETANDIGQDIINRTAQDGTPPPAIIVREGLQTIDAIISKVAETSAITADTIARYVKASPELSKIIGSNVYVSPTFNSSFTSVLRAFDAVNRAESGFNIFFAEAKRGYTSRSLKSSSNNFKSNVVLFNMYYGAIEGISATLGALFEGPAAIIRDVNIPSLNKIMDIAPSRGHAFSTESVAAFNRYAKKSPRNKLEAQIFDAMHNSGIFDNTNIANEVSMLEKGSLITKGLEAIGAKSASRVLKKVNTSLDSAYTFGDNYFKFLSTYIETANAMSQLSKLEGSSMRARIFSADVPTATIKYGNNLFMKVARDSDGNIWKVSKQKYGYSADVKLSTGDKLTPQMVNILVKGGSRSAFDKFVDYENIPGYLSWLRANAGGGVVSLFTTWNWKLMDLPGKRGIGSHFLDGRGVVWESNSPAIAKRISQDGVNRGAARMALLGIAKSSLDKDQDGDIRRMLAYNKRGLAPITYATTAIDPFMLVYKDENAINFFGPSETAVRGLIGTGIMAAKVVESGLNMLGVKTEEMKTSEYIKFEDKEEGVLSHDVRKMYLKWKSGQLISAKDTLSIAGFAGNPIFDFFDLMLESDKNASIDLSNYAAKTIKTVIMGGTLKQSMNAVYATMKTPEELVGREGSTAAKLLFYDIYKKAEYYKYTSLDIERQKTMARQLINIPLGTAYRYAFAHKRYGKKDIGKFKQWTDSFEKKLTASLSAQYKKRLIALAEAGVPENDPMSKRAEERYLILATAVKLEVAAFKERLFDAIDKTGMYDD